MQNTVIYWHTVSGAYAVKIRTLVVNSIYQTPNALLRQDAISRARSLIEQACNLLLNANYNAYVDAIELTKKAIAIYKLQDRRLIFNEYAQALTIIGALDFARGYYQQALLSYETAANLFRPTSPIYFDKKEILSNAVKGTTLLNIAKTYFAIGENLKSLSSYEMTLDFSEKNNDKKLERQALEGIASIYSYSKIHKKTIEYCKKSISTINDINITQFDTIEQACIIGTLILLGTAYSNTGEYKKSLNSLEKSLDFCNDSTNTNIDHLKALTIGYIGIVYINLQNFSAGCKFFEKAIEIYESQTNFENLQPEGLQDYASLNVSIGDFYSARKQHSHALGHYQTSLNSIGRILHSLNPHEKFTKAKALIGMSINSRATGQYQEAIHQSRKAQTLLIDVLHSGIDNSTPYLVTSTITIFDLFILQYSNTSINIKDLQQVLTLLIETLETWNQAPLQSTQPNRALLHWTWPAVEACMRVQEALAAKPLRMSSEHRPALLEAFQQARSNWLNLAQRVLALAEPDLDHEFDEATRPLLEAVLENAVQSGDASWAAHWALQTQGYRSRQQQIVLAAQAQCPADAAPALRDWYAHMSQVHALDNEMSGLAAALRKHRQSMKALQKRMADPYEQQASSAASATGDNEATTQAEPLAVAAWEPDPELQQQAIRLEETIYQGQETLQSQLAQRRAVWAATEAIESTLRQQGLALPQLNKSVHDIDAQMETVLCQWATVHGLIALVMPVVLDAHWVLLERRVTASPDSAPQVEPWCMHLWDEVPSSTHIRASSQQLQNMGWGDSRSVRGTMGAEDGLQTAPETTIDTWLQLHQQSPGWQHLCDDLQAQGISTVHCIPSGDLHLLAWAHSPKPDRAQGAVSQQWRQFPSVSAWLQCAQDLCAKTIDTPQPPRWACLAHDYKNDLNWLSLEALALRQLWAQAATKPDGTSAVHALSEKNPRWPAEAGTGYSAPTTPHVNGFLGLGHGGAPQGNWVHAGLQLSDDRTFSAADLPQVRTVQRLVLSCCSLGRIQDCQGEPLGLTALAFISGDMRLTVGAAAPIDDQGAAFFSMALHHAWVGAFAQAASTGGLMDWGGVFHSTRQCIMQAQWPEGFGAWLHTQAPSLAADKSVSRLYFRLDMSLEAALQAMAAAPNAQVRHVAALMQCLG